MKCKTVIKLVNKEAPFLSPPKIGEIQPNSKYLENLYPLKHEHQLLEKALSQ